MFMEKKKKETLTDPLTASHVVWMLRNLPEDVKDIFVPSNQDDLDQLAINTAKFVARASERDAVMQIQRALGLSLRPNESFHRTMTRAKIKEVKIAKGKQSKND